MVAILSDQHSALTLWMDTHDVKGVLPDAWPSLESLGHGVARVAGRLGNAMKSTWDGAAARFAANTADRARLNADLAAAMARAASQAASSLNETTKSALDSLLSGVRRAFQFGKSLVESIKALRDGVKEIFGRAAERAKLVAITEASRAYHYVQQQVAQRFDPDLIGWRWKTAEGACPICLEIEATAPVVAVGQKFAVIGEGPYADVEYPPAHPRCRCSMEEVFIGDEVERWGVTAINPGQTKPRAKSLVPRRLPPPRRLPTAKFKHREPA